MGIFVQHALVTAILTGVVGVAVAYLTRKFNRFEGRVNGHVAELEERLEALEVAPPKHGRRGRKAERPDGQ